MSDNIWINALIIFGIRVLSVSIGTIRILLMGRANKALVSLIAFFDALSFVITLGLVAQDFNSIVNVLAYSGGFAGGTLVGMWLEERMGMGFRTIIIISQGHSLPIVEKIRKEGFGATRSPGEGTSGSVGFIWVVVRRKDANRVMELAQKIDEKAFITINSTQTVYRGFLGTRV